MAFIKVIDEALAEGKLKVVYDDIAKSRGKLSNIMKIHSLNPEAMIKHMDLYKAIMFGKSNLSRELKEMIAVVVSVSNKCEYCINHHAEALNFYWKDREKVELLIRDFRKIETESGVKLLLDYTALLTISPDQITKTIIDEIKSSGWSDEDILSVNLIISYFNFVNRIALGLGVEFSEEEIKGYKY
ncbi:MAG: peroxidase [Ignavibacteria bacterium CG22_combo_CG10-13_8_21_14_all_37_15]|nr:MAG: peroxidase [Ignavibacteria bacterium CG22_combo_CG10-13_8_21_14_all_37_15]PIS46015.1 MAG: peroxidase [Ignavibacteria bacterium CG08_land_8_20_14_0_20_37_9]PJC58918.1 MAG: peroxidase [Ignavibacteria bacterium CG_4_9_14_0_2_um_filter_37_13]